MPTPPDRRVLSAGRAAYRRWGSVVWELLKFGLVGAVAFVIDTGTFNLILILTDGDKPLTAKTVSVLLATTFAYVGNRHWTFRHRGRPGLRREYALFLLLNAVGLAISLACLFVSHYLLDLTSPLADNVSANGVGLALGTTFRFWAYRRWVFPHAHAEAAAADAAAAHVMTADVLAPPPAPATSPSPGRWLPVAEQPRP